LDDGKMSYHLTDLVMMEGICMRIPHLEQCTPHLILHLMENVALGYAWTPLKEVMHVHSTLDVGLLTLDVEYMEDDVMCYDYFMMIGACLPSGHHFDDEMGFLNNKM
jgi:hypothetical protein